MSSAPSARRARSGLGARGALWLALPLWALLGSLACSGGLEAPARGVVRVEEAPLGTELFVDARLVGPATAPSELWLEAGDHVLEARAGTTVVAHAVVHVSPNASVPVRLVPGEPSAGPALPPPPPDPAVALPAPALLADPPDEPPPEAGERSASDVEAVVARHRGELRRCFEESLRASPEAGTARFDVTVALTPEGMVSSVELARGVGGTSELPACIEAAVRTWTFPPAAARGTIEFPVVFTSG